jgi:predicted transposase/invertase (TIGR01784 family)
VGIEQGTEQGVQKEKQNIAIAMKQKGLSINDIADITGLSVSEITKL